MPKGAHAGRVEPAELDRAYVKPCMEEIEEIVRTGPLWSANSFNNGYVDAQFKRQILPKVRDFVELQPAIFDQFAAWLGVEATVDAVMEELRLRAYSMYARRLWQSEVDRYEAGKGRRVWWPQPELRTSAT